MGWRAFRAHLILVREDAEEMQRNEEGREPQLDPDRPDLQDRRYGRPPPEQEMRHIPWAPGEQEKAL